MGRSSALARALFEEHGLLRVASGSAPTLDAELVAFEEIRSPERKARVQVIMTLDDDRAGSQQATISVEQPIHAAIGSDDASAVVEALSLALEQCVAQIAERVEDSVSTASAPVTVHSE